MKIKSRDGGLVGRPNFPTQTKAKGVWTIQDVFNAIKNAIWPRNIADPYYDNLHTYLQFEEVAGVVYFKDNAKYPKGWKASGNATTSSGVKKFGSNSLLLDGNGDFLTASHSADLSLSSVCYDFWIYLSAINRSHALNGKRAGANNTAFIWSIASDNMIDFYLSTDGFNWNVAWTTLSHTAFTATTWYHLRLVIKNNLIKIFINGSLVGSNSFTGTVAQDTGPYHLGATYPSESTTALYGYIDEFKIYNTDPYPQHFVPASYTTNLTVNDPTNFNLLKAGLHFDGTNGSQVMADIQGTQWTAISGAQLSNIQSKFGGTSLKLNGTTDYIQTTAVQKFAIATTTTPFTLECWVYLNTIPNGEAVITSAYPGSGVVPYVLGFSSGVQDNPVGGAYPFFGWWNGSSWQCIGQTSQAVTTGQWYHIAGTYDGSTQRIFVDGVLKGSRNSSTRSTSALQSPLYIGRRWDTAGTRNYIDGYIEDVQIYEGYCKYTSDFTPPSSTFVNPVDSTDSYWSSTTLALNFEDGIKDLKGHPITVAGNAGQSSGQVKYGTYSLYLDGTGDYLTTPYSTSLFDWWTTDYTLEFWVYYNSFTGADNGGLLSTLGHFAATSTNNYWSIGANTSGVLRFYYYNGGTNFFNSNKTLSINTWYHIAFVKSGSEILFFLNGELTNRGTVSGTPQSSTGDTLTIGSYNNTAINAYLDEIRITKGVARYTNSFTLPSISPTYSNTGSDPYFASNVTLLCNFNGSNGSAYDFHDATGNQMTGSGNASLSTAQYKFGNSSLYLDGTGDYVTTTYVSANHRPIGSDFTLELWVRYVSFTGAGTSNVPSLIGHSAPTSTASNWAFGAYTDGNVYFRYWRGSEVLLNTGYTLSLNTWYHLALVYNNTNSSFYVYVDGVLKGILVYIATMNEDSANLTIGSYNNVATNAYIDSIRITKGIARYIPTTESLTTTLLHFNGTNGSTTFTDNGTGATSWSAVGSAQLDTSIKKYGSASLKILNDGDYISGAMSTFGKIGTNNFTMECWVYLTTNDSDYQTICRSDSSNGPDFGINLSNNKVFIGKTGVDSVGSSIGLSPGFTTGQWYHIAVTRSGTTLRFFVDGIQLGTDLTYSSDINLTTGTIRIGGNAFSNAYNIRGYIDDFRVVIGSTLYTTNFTPPTGEHSNGNTTVFTVPQSEFPNY